METSSITDTPFNFNFFTLTHKSQMYNSTCLRKQKWIIKYIKNETKQNTTKLALVHFKLAFELYEKIFTLNN